MAELNKGQLTAENTASFPNNTVGYITPTLLRTFNQNMIDSLVDEVTYNSDSASVSASISQLKNFSSSLDATFATDAQLSASASTLQNNINLKVNTSSTSSMTVLSSSYSVSSSFSLTASYAENAGVFNTSSLVTTASFNAYTASATITSASFNARINALDPSSSAEAIDALNLFTSSQYVSNSLFIQASQTSSMSVLSSSYAVSASRAISASYALFAETSSFALTSSITQQVSTSISTQNLQHNVLFVDTTGPGFVQVDGGLRYNPNTNLLTTTASLALTASFAENVPSNFATTGSNTFNGNQIISGNLDIAGNITALSASFTYLKTIYETASIIFSSGSNQLGDELSDVQTLSGSVKVQGGLTVNGVNVLSSSVNEDGYLLTSSFNTYTASASTNVSGAINSATQSLSSSIATTDAGQDSKINSLISVTGSYATTGSNTFIGNQIISGNLLVTGSEINLEVDAPALSIGTTNVKTILDATASGVVSSTDITRLGAGPTGDLTGIRLQTLSGSDTTGDTLLSRINTGINRHTSTAMTGSVVNTTITSTWATGSGGTRVAYQTSINANAQSASATLTLNAGNLASNNVGGTASIAAGLIRIGTNVAHTISSTGSFGPMILVSPLNTPALAIRSGSFELTTPQGSGSFYTNLPITSSGMRLNGDARFSGIEVIGLVGANGSGSVYVENAITASVVSASQYIGFIESASYATTASFALNVPTNLATTGSNNFIGNQSISGSIAITGSTPTQQWVSGGLNLSGSLISNVTDIYTGSNNANFIVTLGSASMASLIAAGTTNPNTIYFVI